MHAGIVKLLTLSVATFLFSFAYTQTQSSIKDESAFVYRLTIEDCRQPPAETRQQTGFQVEGVEGIVTALHGVLDCGNIAAYSEVNDTKLFNLVIKEVDIERDLAVLVPGDSGESPLPTGGLEESVNSAESCEGFYVLGYALTTQAQAAIPVNRQGCYTEALAPNVTDSIRATLRQRGSPNPALDVYRLSSDVVPGHSGAPLLNTEGEVVGVAQGGLDDGRVGVAWAAIWADRNFVPKESEQERLEELKNRSLKGVFTVAVNPDTQLGQLTVRFAYGLGRFEDAVVNTQGKTGKWQLETASPVITDEVRNVIINEERNETVVSGVLEDKYFEASREQLKFTVEKEGSIYFLSVLPNEIQDAAINPVEFGIFMRVAGREGQKIGTDLKQTDFQIVSPPEYSVDYDYPTEFQRDLLDFCLYQSVGVGEKLEWDDLSVCGEPPREPRRTPRR